MEYFVLRTYTGTICSYFAMVRYKIVFLEMYKNLNITVNNYKELIRVISLNYEINKQTSIIIS